MTVLAYNLANGIKGSWRVVFVPDDLHLMWNSASQTPTQNPADWMSLMISCMAAESALDERARDSLVSLIKALTGR
ncbi:hypothetical protein [Mesorhizobium sp. M0768]|uniref:hypothetical protein n=1 Tax=Mesorhizobium sp. M0768 TaxID=2956996 RepID=UPI00333C25D4